MLGSEDSAELYIDPTALLDMVLHSAIPSAIAASGDCIYHAARPILEEVGNVPDGITMR